MSRKQGRLALNWSSVRSRRRASLASSACPGPKSTVFNALVDSKIKTVVCRHEQNAAFIAGGIGRMTGKAGVAIATSGTVIGVVIKSPDDIAPVMKKAFDMAGPVIVGVHVDYTDNHKLFEMVKGDSIH